MAEVVHPLGFVLDLGYIIKGVFGKAVTGIKFVILGVREISDVILFEGDLLDGGGF